MMFPPKLNDKTIEPYSNAAESCYRVGRYDLAMQITNDIYAYKFNDIKTNRTLRYVKRINFEISSVCNLKCKYCTFRSGKREKYIDPDLFEKIVREVARDIPTLERLALYMSGESLLHPQFVELLEIVVAIKKEYPAFRPQVYLHTNGMLWTPEMNDRIMATGALDQVVWSIDGTNPDSFEEMRAGAKFDRVMDHYAYFLDHKTDDVEAVVNNLVEQPVDPRQYHPRMQELFARADRVTTIMPKPLNEKVPHSVCEWIGNPTGFCDYIFHTIIVTTSGQMSLCCIDYNSLNAFGDMKQDSFVDTYFSREHFEMMQKMADGRRAEIKGCAHCKAVKNGWSNDTAAQALAFAKAVQWDACIRKTWKEWLMKQGYKRVAIFGAGKFSDRLAECLLGQDGPVVAAVVDDQCEGKKIFDVPVQSPESMDARDVDAIVLATDCWQEEMAVRCRELYGDRITLLSFDC